MSKQTAKDLTLNYFNAWKNKDFDKVATLLSDDITFEMPINNYETKEVFLQAVEFTVGEATDVKLLTATGMSMKPCYFKPQFNRLAATYYL